MVNGMGGTPQSELSIAVKYIAQVFEQQNVEVGHWFVGDFMTSLDMQGLSVTLMPYEETLSKALTAPTASPYFN